MSAVMKILRRIGGVKAPPAPASGSAGQLAMWKAGVAAGDKRALYMHDGVNFVPIVDYATETFPGVAAIATQAEAYAGVDKEKIITPDTLSYYARRKLHAPLDLYVRKDGSDSNDGSANTPANAFQTITRAVQETWQYDARANKVTINVGPGTYNEFVQLFRSSLDGGFWLVGDEANPSNVVVNCTNRNQACFYASNPYKINIRGFKLTSTGSGVVAIQNYCNLVLANIEWGACSVAHFKTEAGAYTEFEMRHIISGSSPFHIRASNNAMVYHATSGAKAPHWSFVGSHAFSAFVDAQMGCIVQLDGVTFTGGNLVTGKRYQASSNGVISVGGAGPNFLPGNAAGTLATGGQYV
jgi:hypothetical protein